MRFYFFPVVLLTGSYVRALFLNHTGSLAYISSSRTAIIFRTYFLFIVCRNFNFICFEDNTFKYSWQALWKTK